MESETPGGEPAEFEILFRENYPAIVRAALRVAGSRQEAEEIAAEAFVKLYRAGKAVQNPIGWLKRCAVRQALDCLRSSKRRKNREWSVPNPSETAETPEMAFRLTQDRLQVRLVLAGLSERDAEILLARAGGSTYLEIANDFGIHPASVGKLLTRAEEKFKTRYQRLYGTR